MQKFIHLHTHSHYSLLDGLPKIDDLVKKVKDLGMDSIALTDHGVLYGAIEFYKKAKKAGIKPILGVETYVAPKSRLDRDTTGERYYHLILLAENNIGWKNLIKLVTKAHLEGFYYKPRVDKEILRQHSEGLIALSACLGGEVDQALMADNFEEAKKVALEYKDIFGENNFFIEIQKHPNLPESEKIEPEIIRLSKETGIPLVATQDLHYLNPEDGHYHDILLAIQTGNKLSDDDRLSLKTDDFSLCSQERMVEKLGFVPEALDNTQKIADRCNVELELGKTLLPEFPKPDGKTASVYLRELVEKRLPERYPNGITKEVRDRIEYEMSVVEKTGFEDYFLIVQDLINWAKDHGISVGPGRGSAAGSLVSYVLKITDIDPLTYDLLFERFLNPERIQMPDIDIDFADIRRDEVLAYAREKYGADHVAQIITFGTMAARAAVRDAGRAMGLPYSFCDKIAKLIPGLPNTKLKDALEKTDDLKALYKSDANAKNLIDAAMHLEGVARHASVHACGTVIAREPLDERVPLQFAPQDKDIIISQFEMHAIEDLGLLKIDFLGLKNLTIIEETIRLVKELQDINIKIEDIPLDDEQTFALLKKGDTTGVFQFESSGMRRYMKDIKPSGIEDLIALVALYRPGPMELIPTFIKRKNGQEKITYLHPKLEPILGNTYGIGVYQEQMMRIARDLAGYSLAEADTLRKAIGKKIKELLDEQQEKLVSGMMKNGIDQKTARAIWELFPPFARYGFNKSHAACYALIGYRTAYLRAHYPEEFMASLLNADIGDTDRMSFLTGEAKQENLEVLGPDVNKSYVKFAPDGPKIRFGLLAIKNVGEAIAQAIVEERTRGGEYKDFADFVTRIEHKDLNKKSLESLAKSGALDSFGFERNQILQNMDDILKYHNSLRKNLFSAQNSLFGNTPSAIPPLTLQPAEPATPTQRLTWEKELLGFYLSDHPLNHYGDKIKVIKARTVAELRAVKDERLIYRGAGLISSIKKIMTKTGQPMLFVTMEDFSPQPIELVVFNNTMLKTQDVWVENKIIAVEGKISFRNGEPSMIVEKAKSLEA